MLVMQRPKVTVLMTVYNSEKFVGAAIESVLSQTICFKPNANCQRARHILVSGLLALPQNHQAISKYAEVNQKMLLHQIDTSPVVPNWKN